MQINLSATKVCEQVAAGDAGVWEDDWDDFVAANNARQKGKHGVWAVILLPFLR